MFVEDYWAFGYRKNNLPYDRLHKVMRSTAVLRRFSRKIPCI